MDWISKQCGGNLMYRALIEKKNNQKAIVFFTIAFLCTHFKMKIQTLY